MTRTIVAGLAVALAFGGATTRASDIPAARPDAPPTAAPAQRADILAARHSWAEARDAYLEALRPEAVLHNKLGICYQHLGELDRARAEYRRALEIRPDYARAWNNLGTLDHAARAYDSAIVAYEKAIALDPGDVVVYKNLGQAWLAQDEVEKALSAFREALRLDPDALVRRDAGSLPAGSVDVGRQYFLFAKLVAARGDVATALELLGMAREHGFDAVAEVEGDPDFQAVVGDPRWASMAR